ncbi:MAG TPA: hypothetical protein VF064_09990, partial [Pyrinomonadaceae bacterium]
VGVTDSPERLGELEQREMLYEKGGVARDQARGDDAAPQLGRHLGGVRPPDEPRLVRWDRRMFVHT